MARSISGNFKGALTHLPNAMGWNRPQGGGQDSPGCGGCLVILILVWLVTFVIQFWVPIASIIGAVLLVAIAVKLVILARDRRDSMQPNENGVSPPLAPPQRTESPPAAWYPDPLGEHHYRYWDGSQWSDLVADDSRVTSHPL